MTSCTNSEKIMDALDLLDEDMALAVQKLREKKKKRRPVLWRYGVVAACFALVLLGVLQLYPWERLHDSAEMAGGAPEDIGMSSPSLNSPTQTPTESQVTAGENGGNDEGTDLESENEGNESQSGTTGGVSDDEESLGGGTEGMPGDEPLPSLELRIEGYDGDTVVCTVVGNEGCTFYPVGSVVVLRFDFWEGEPITEASFTPGGVYNVLFNVGYDGDDENTLYAVTGYRLEE